MRQADLKEFLNEKYHQYNTKEFLDTDPIQIPHRYSNPRDIEIAGFLTATISWGNRKSIINNAKKLVEIMEDSPHDFITNHTEQDLKRCAGYVHRTFQEVDLLFFMEALKNIYKKYDSMEDVFAEGIQSGNGIGGAIDHFRSKLFSSEHLKRSEKHVSSPGKNSSAKRLNMYLRWMVRSDDNGVDFGIWKSISPSILELPLDVHTACVSRKLGILKRKQQDWKSVIEIGNALRKLDSQDPVKYDFALFGLGVFEGFCK